MRDLVRAYKFGGRTALARLFAGQIASRLRAGSLPAFTVIVPAPARPAGVRRRGYDHMQLIAAVLRRHHGLPVANVLRRRSGREQKVLDYQQRARNLDGRLSVARRRAAATSEVAGRRILLIDDVFTTGATINECARVLAAAGASEIWSLTLARD